MADAVYKYHERYQFDSYFDLGTRNRLRITDCFDAVVYDINDEAGHMNFRDKSLELTPDEIMKLILKKGIKKFVYENVLPIRFNVKNREDAAERIAAAGKELAEFNSSKGAVAKKMRTEYGVPTLFGPGILNTVEELFMGSILGIKDMSVCMRRYADLFEDFITQMSVSWKKEVAGRMDACPNDGESVFQFNTPNLAHTITNPKQFGRYYWPQMKWMCDEIYKHDFNCFIQGEGFMNIQYDFYKELPDKHFAMLIEMNTPQEVKAALPNITVVGGYPTSWLANKTVEECVDKAKQLLDTVGADGRWMYSTDKMLSYKNDVRIETMSAVNDYIREHGKL